MSYNCTSDYVNRPVAYHAERTAVASAGMGCASARNIYKESLAPPSPLCPWREVRHDAFLLGERVRVPLLAAALLALHNAQPSRRPSSAQSFGHRTASSSPARSPRSPPGFVLHDGLMSTASSSLRMMRRNGAAATTAHSFDRRTSSSSPARSPRSPPVRAPRNGGAATALAAAAPAAVSRQAGNGTSYGVQSEAEEEAAHAMQQSLELMVSLMSPRSESSTPRPSARRVSGTALTFALLAWYYIAVLTCALCNTASGRHQSASAKCAIDLSLHDQSSNANTQ